MSFSRFGDKFTGESGVLQLMDDLGAAVDASEDILMLGGGNPARIPEVERVFRRRIQEILDTPGEFETLIGNYDAPQGNRALIEALADLLSERYRWEVRPSNVALTAGSQTSFFFLFNLLAGEMADGKRTRILLPLTPEYMGYAESGITHDFFVSSRPEIELIGDDLFKYHVDFDAVSVGDDVAAVCVSRPTNPTANVLTAFELERLSAVTSEKGIPFIIDNAYGTPFPNIIFEDAAPIWNDGVVLTMSLSKLGLPGVRTGIVIAREEIIRALAGLNAVVSLAPGSFGAALTRGLVRSGEIIDISREVIRPYYLKKSEQALTWVREAMAGLPYRVHKPEGTFFFWIWFEGLPVTSQELYQRLKARGVFVVPGQHFFPGLREDWRHRNECLRVNYSQDDDTVSKGIAVIAEEAKRAYAGGGS